ncbi:MAG: hypothetical protein WBW32_10860 [Luteibacter sp.]
MKALESIRTAVAFRLRAQSNDAFTNVKLALACVMHLHDLDCTVKEIVIRPKCVTVEIDPPNGALRGSLHINRVNGHYRERVMVTTALRCQVQWVERTDLRPAAQGA